MALAVYRIVRVCQNKNHRPVTTLMGLATVYLDTMDHPVSKVLKLARLIPTN